MEVEPEYTANAVRTLLLLCAPTLVHKFTQRTPHSSRPPSHLTLKSVREEVQRAAHSQARHSPVVGRNAVETGAGYPPAVRGYRRNRCYVQTSGRCPGGRLAVLRCTEVEEVGWGCRAAQEPSNQSPEEGQRHCDDVGVSYVLEGGRP